MIVNTSFLFFLSAFTLLNCSKFDYYWRDYYGEIPEDAVPGGLDKTLNTTYIAQVHIPKHGIQTARLYKGDKSVTASHYGIHSSDVFIKILCSDRPEKLVWIPANASELHLQTIGKHLVVGGTENEKVVNIGRVSYQGEVIVGKVCGYNIGDARLFFPFKTEEKSVSSYEVLVYNDEASLIDPRLYKK